MVNMVVGPSGGVVTERAKEILSRLREGEENSTLLIDCIGAASAFRMPGLEVTMGHAEHLEELIHLFPDVAQFKSVLVYGIQYIWGTAEDKVRVRFIEAVNKSMLCDIWLFWSTHPQAPVIEADYLATEIKAIVEKL